MGESYLLHVFLGSPEDHDRYFLERLGVSSYASNMASRSSIGMIS